MLAKRVAPFVARAQEMRLRGPDLDIHDLLGTARQQALLEDFGPGDFRPGLDVFVDSINADVRPNRVGAQLLRELIGVQLRNRVGVRDWSKKNPDSRIEVISDPIVVCGLPGSGIDLLASLVGHDPDVRVLRVGEAVVTAPPGGALPVSYRQDPRAPSVTELSLRLRRLLAGSALTGELPEPSRPASDEVALAGHFFSPFAASLIGATSYVEWAETADATPAYQWHHSMLQVLQACEPTSQWLLHGGVHLGHLDALLSVHPGARLVWVHRDPAATAGHEAALAKAVRLALRDDSLSDGDLSNGGRSSGGDRLSSHLDQIERAAATIEDRGLEVLHLHHAELREDPVGTVARIYRRFDLDLSTAAQWRMDAWLARRRTADTPGTHASGAAAGSADEQRREAYLRRREVFNEAPG